MVSLNLERLGEGIQRWLNGRTITDEQVHRPGPARPGPLLPAAAAAREPDVIRTRGIRDVE